MPDLTQTFLDVPWWLWMVGALLIIALTIVFIRRLDFEGVNLTAMPPFITLRFKTKSTQSLPVQTAIVNPGGSPSVDISRNKSLGRTHLDIKRGDVRVDDNLFAGKTDIRVEDDQKKPH